MPCLLHVGHQGLVNHHLSFMSVALAGRSPATFDIKSASLPMLTLRLKSADLDMLAQELQAQYGETPGFFDHDLLVIDLVTLAPEQVDWPIDFVRLGELTRQFGLYPVAVRGGNPQQMATALAAGLPAAVDMRVQAQQQAAADVDESLLPGAMVVDRPLRSGQQVYARGRDLVVLAMVNPGAEVIADGHIHVYAPLRGRAIAGARGWGEARIFARDMQPELVSIAGVYRTSDEPLPESVWGRAASVTLSRGELGDQLFFEPIRD